MSAEAEEGRVEAAAWALREAFDHAECMGDTRSHNPVPVWGDRSIDPHDSDRWIDYAARAALAAADRYDREQGWRVVKLELPQPSHEAIRKGERPWACVTDERETG